MDVFYHHIYELKKGLRRLVLFTSKKENIPYVEERLHREGIPHIVCEVSPRKSNVFFGDQSCIDVLNCFKTLNLSYLSDEEDFILGTLLGYDLKIQCQRYLKRKNEQVA